jgi:hypothetical protein
MRIREVCICGYHCQDIELSHAIQLEVLGELATFSDPARQFLATIETTERLRPGHKVTARYALDPRQFAPVTARVRPGGCALNVCVELAALARRDNIPLKTHFIDHATSDSPFRQYCRNSGILLHEVAWHRPQMNLVFCHQGDKGTIRSPLQMLDGLTDSSAREWDRVQRLSRPLTTSHLGWG